jgi:DAPG hydrolase PhiG domain
VPGAYVGATHLTHQRYGGEGPLMRAAITFLEPSELFNAATLAEHAIGATVCASVRLVDEAGVEEPDEAVRFAHVALAHAWGTELRSAFWLTVTPATNVERATVGRLRHVHEEFAELAGFLPAVYRERAAPAANTTSSSHPTIGG